MPFAVSQGMVNALRPAAASLYSMPPPYMHVGQDQYSTYEQMWKTQPALRTVIEFLARNVAELGLDVFQRSSDTDRKKLRDHPLARLLDNPWPGSKWSKYRLINWTVQEYLLFNSAIWLKGRTSDGSNGVLPVPRRTVELRGDNLFFADAYRISGTKGYRDLSPDEVVHFCGYNPDNPRDGWSPVETLRQTLAEEYAATCYREQLWKNGARISGYIKRSEKAPRWSDTARNRFKAEWQTYSTDMAAGGTPILEDGMEWSQGGITPKDAQYVEARQLTWEEVAIAYHVNPVMMGLDNNQTSGNVPELHQMLYADTLGPLLEMLQQDIETQLLPDLNPNRNVYVEFNLRKKMQGSFEAQAAAISSSVGGPWMTRNEGRALYNLPELDDAEELITPMNVTAGGLASPRDTAPNNPSNEESNGQPPKPQPIGSTP
jgi:HK97 family phage portal protein